MVAINNTSILFQSIFTILNITVDPEETGSYNNYYRSIGKEPIQSKCYGIYGCFDLQSPWTSENRPVALLPESIRKVEPKLTYFTRDNPKIGVRFDLDETDVITQSGIDPSLRVFVIIHGFTESGNHYWVKQMTHELLIRFNANIIVVDWQGGSSPPYTQAVANIRLVAAITANLLADLAQFTQNLDHVHVIGHSLGAHLSGYIGYTLQDDFDGLILGRITGLDPAEPHFAKANRPVRLDKSAAKFVDIIHTDASQFIRGGLGMTEAIGHVDFYPNGGTNQPGCDKSVTEFAIENGGSLINGIKKFLGCNHVRSYLYFIESINSNCSFYGITCKDYDEYVAGNCFDCSAKDQFCMPMGFHSKQHYDALLANRTLTRRRGASLYLRTADVAPFCKEPIKLSVQISDSNESKKHGGEIGQLWFVLHDTTDRRGQKTGRVALNKGGYHEPGKLYTEIISMDKRLHLKGLEVEWDYHSNVFNPLTWRLLAAPRVHVAKIKVESLEPKERLSVCPKEKNQPLISGIPQLMLPSYC